MSQVGAIVDTVGEKMALARGINCFEMPRELGARGRALFAGQQETTSSELHRSHWRGGISCSLNVEPAFWQRPAIA